MLRGIRRPEDAQALGVSQRLLVRLGALLKQAVEVTPAVLEQARPGSPVERLLLDPAVLEKAAALDDAALRELAAAHLKADAASAHETLAVAPGEGGARVVCLPEELEAGDAWDAAPAGGGAAARSPGGSVLARSPTGEDARGTPAAESALARADSDRPLASRLAAGDVGRGTLFTPLELDRLRLRLVTSAETSERIEALRLLAYAPLPAHEKAEVLFRALEDRDVTVRAEAAGLLFILGIPNEVAEALRGLTEGPEPARLRAADRLCKLLTPETPELTRVAAAVCALAALRPEPPGPFAAFLLEVLARGAPALVNAPARLAELVRVVLTLLGAALGKGATPGAGDRLYGPANHLFAALIQAAPGAVVAILREQRDKTSDRAVEAFLLQHILEAGRPGAPEEPELLRLCARFLARDAEEGRDSRSVGMSMATRGEAAVTALVEVFPEATPSAQKYILRVTDDLVRYQKLSPAAHERVAEIVLRGLGASHRPLRMVAMNCRGIAREEVPEPLRERLAESFLNSIGDFGFRSDVEIAEDTLALLGLPAIGPLTRRLAPERPADQRVQAARLIGNLALELKPPPGQFRRATEAVTELVRQLQALTLEPSFPDRRVLLTALGKLVACPAASQEAAEVVTRNLVQASESPDPQRQFEALEALTWVAAARRAQPDLITRVVKLLREALDRAQTGVAAQTRTGADDTVIEIPDDPGLVDVVPAALGGISRIARSRSCPPVLLRELVELLIARWKDILAGTLIWGPGNSLCLVRALQEVGCHEDLPDELRMNILKALAPRLMYAPVLPAVGAILAAADGEATGPAALSLGLAITGKRTPDGRYEAEDRAEILKVLARIAARRHLGAPGGPGPERARRFRETVVDDLFRGAQDVVPGAYEGLVAIRDARLLPEDGQAALERRIAEFHALALPLGI